MLLLTALMLHGAPPAPLPRLSYAVDLRDAARHLFTVTLQVPPLAAENGVFEFAATAPGTYQTMDIGRFVRDFEALDASGGVVATERIGVNEWRMADPSRVRTVRYRVLGTRDTTVTEHIVYPMCGSHLGADYALINGQAVFGFPHGFQAAPISVRLQSPAGWNAATALPFADGAYRAESYDQLVDSPFLIGAHLTSATLAITGVPVRIVVESERGGIQATQLRDAMRDMLSAAGNFLGKLPVDRYVFLYDFGPQGFGAWEHSYSSEYVLKDTTFTPAVGARVTDIAAHEFFHVVTPLNIHSEIIEHFNFTTPTPSQHLWLYEGTTEWAAHKMQLMAGLKPLSTYLSTMVFKETIDRARFDTAYSLVKLSQTSYSDSGQRQYANIYMRGALVAGLLDIRLLELSQGRQGLRDLILNLARTYGKHRAFPEDALIDTIVARTSPDVRDFFTRYVYGAERPPLKEYYAKLGITLVEDDKGAPVRFDVDPNPTAEQLALRKAWMGPKARLN